MSTLTAEQVKEANKRALFVKAMASELWLVYENHLNRAMYSKLELISIAAAMSTLWVMDLRADFCRAQQFFAYGFPRILKRFGPFDPCELASCMMSCFELTGDELFLTIVNDLSSSAFASKMPDEVVSLVDITEGMSAAIDFGYRTNNARYWKYTGKVVDILKQSAKLPDARYHSLYSSKTKKFYKTKKPLSSRLQMLHSSFYFNILRLHLQTNLNSALAVYKEAILDELDNGLIWRKLWPTTTVQSEKSETVRWNNCTLVRSDFNADTSYMYSRCFYFGGMLQLGARSMRKQLKSRTEANKTVAFNGKRELRQITCQEQMAEALIETAHKICASTKTGLPPSRFKIEEYEEHQRVEHETVVRGVKYSTDSGYDLSSELAQSYFILWRLTGDLKYREYSWQLVQAIASHCRLADGSYLAVANVNEVPTVKLSYPNPYFLGATLKYLYLTFADVSVLPLEKWVFNEIGQPLPIIDKSKLANL